MLKLNKETKTQLLELYQKQRVSLEGNILKLIDSEEDSEFKEYLTAAIERDSTIRRKRLDITRQVQSQNADLIKWKEENEKVQKQLTESLHELEASKEEAERAKNEAEAAREEAENAKQHAENDLDMLQKRTQFQLINTIVKMALFVIVGVGVTTTILYVTAILSNKDTQIIGSTWSNMFGILLTNAFSIVGTIMGVKYASEKNN